MRCRMPRTRAAIEDGWLVPHSIRVLRPSPSRHSYDNLFSYSTRIVTPQSRLSPRNPFTRMEALAKSKTITARRLEDSPAVLDETFSRRTIRSNTCSVLSMQPANRARDEKDFRQDWEPRNNAGILPQSSPRSFAHRYAGAAFLRFLPKKPQAKTISSRCSGLFISSRPDCSFTSPLDSFSHLKNRS